MKKETYKILKLHAENVKRLSVVDITPDENTVIISGANGNGKSSVLDSIEMALRGGDTIPDVPIRNGQDDAMIELDLGKLKVRRTFTDKGSYLKVMAQDGAVYGSPQKMLDEMLGAIAFDPLEFTRMSSKDQYETIRKMVKVDVDIDALDEKIKADEAERTIVGREEKAIAAQIAGMVIPENTPAEPVDVTVKSQAIIKARQDRDRFQTLSQTAQGLEKTREALVQQVRELEAKIAETNVKISENLTESQVAKNTAEELRKSLLSQDDLQALENEIANATSINKAVADAKAKAEKVLQHSEIKKKHERLEAAIEKGRADKAAAIDAADMPIKGLSLVDGTVVFNKVPLAQASTAEQIRVSTAIAMAMNPTLKVIRVKDGSLLDDTSMEAIKKMTKAKGFQLWIEVVNSSDPMAIIIDDGAVVETKKKAKAS